MDTKFASLVDNITDENKKVKEAPRWLLVVFRTRRSL